MAYPCFNIYMGVKHISIFPLYDRIVVFGRFCNVLCQSLPAGAANRADRGHFQSLGLSHGVRTPMDPPLATSMFKVNTSCEKLLFIHLVLVYNIQLLQDRMHISY